MSPVSMTLSDLYARLYGHGIIQRQKTRKIVQDRAIVTMAD